MATIASRDLRNHTARVLRQVSDGERVTITVNGKPVAEVAPIRAARSQYFTKEDLLRLVVDHQADAALSAQLDELTADTTDDLDPL